ncbi:glycosyltransferase involved in cell wall biosynthesis [Salinibacter ruber]|uniref:glycosyltransferase family 4 protein n=1 Tax=Salinibacter ruber TaxID=146919 RepID=UPI00216989C8|nr:glycosyltransferase family 4 protein [Salinibacter ruber]MCS4161429.1 glycosyltransferase involved in cell wall biosynthesis [Salinibacter ruber]
MIHRIDAVVARNSSMAWQAAKISQKSDTPWAIEVVGDTWDALWNHGSIAAKLYAPFADLRKKYWVRRAPFALYVTEHALQERYPCDGRTAGISNVMIPMPRDEVLKRRLSRIKEGESDKIRFGFLGSIENESKGLEFAFRALSAVRPEIRDCELRVLGPGEVAPWISLAKSLGIEDCIEFDGVRPAGEPVLEWLDEIDVYLHPRLQDGLPRSLIEAMSRGCPALSSSVGGIPELLPDFVMHAPGDWETLAQQIVMFSTDDGWLVENARRNFEKAKGYNKEKLRKEREVFWGKFAKLARERRTVN